MKNKNDLVNVTH